MVGPKRDTANATLDPQDFKVKNLQKVEYGRIQWLFDLDLGAVTLLKCRIVADHNQKPAFVAAAQVKDARSQKYISTVRLDRDFANTVFDAVLARINAEAEQGDTRDEWGEEQERRFDREFDALESGRS